MDESIEIISIVKRKSPKGGIDYNVTFRMHWKGPSEEETPEFAIWVRVQGGYADAELEARRLMAERFGHLSRLLSGAKPEGS